HPVTELVYGVDLVREQLRIAQGLPMQLPSGSLTPRGWSLECRITSEDPANGFLPSTGRLEYLRPPAGPGVRWDGGFETGNDITLFYDSLLGKVIVWGPDRAEAINRMRRALQELVVVGVATNQSFHLRLLADDAFLAGDIDSQFLDRRTDLVQPSDAPAHSTALAVAAALAEEARRQSRKPILVENSSTDGSGGWLRTARREGLR
ncbi:MAG TPA: acetyl-CoA carboxylase biotin carboxylase subunit, partial [Gemmatimonadales bacterium]|nr:acetyl-CoA carboxylase biotin carboxylase subunit [Gemmatimonadales bacterium]